MFEVLIYKDKINDSKILTQLSLKQDKFILVNIEKRI